MVRFKVVYVVHIVHTVQSSALSMIIEACHHHRHTARAPDI